MPRTPPRHRLTERRTWLLSILAATLLLAWMLDAQRRVEREHAVAQGAPEAWQPGRSTLGGP